MWVRCASKNSLNRIPGYRYTIYDDGDNNNYCVVFTHGTRSRRFVSRSRDPNRVNCICSGRQLFPLPLPPEQYPRSINNGSALFNLFLSLFHSHSPSPFISPTRHGYSNNIVHLRVLGTFGRPTVAKQFQFFFPPDFPSFPPPHSATVSNTLFWRGTSRRRISRRLFVSLPRINPRRPSLWHPRPAVLRRRRL